MESLNYQCFGATFIQGPPIFPSNSFPLSLALQLLDGVHVNPPALEIHFHYNGVKALCYAGFLYRSFAANGGLFSLIFWLSFT